MRAPSLHETNAPRHGNSTKRPRAQESTTAEYITFDTQDSLIVSGREDDSPLHSAQHTTPTNQRPGRAEKDSRSGKRGSNEQRRRPRPREGQRGQQRQQCRRRRHPLPPVHAPILQQEQPHRHHHRRSPHRRLPPRCHSNMSDRVPRHPHVRRQAPLGPRRVRADPRAGRGPRRSQKGLSGDGPARPRAILLRIRPHPFVSPINPPKCRY